ncbi:MAG: hypothetical protein ACJ8AW_14720 [Rhodopila sp.]
MPTARVELIEAQDWYERAPPGLGRRFRDEAAFQVDRIATHPGRFPETMAGVRRARLRRFPYGLFFGNWRTPSLSSPAFTRVGTRSSGKAV